MDSSNDAGDGDDEEDEEGREGEGGEDGKDDGDIEEEGGNGRSKTVIRPSRLDVDTEQEMEGDTAALAMIETFPQNVLGLGFDEAQKGKLLFRYNRARVNFELIHLADAFAAIRNSEQSFTSVNLYISALTWYWKAQNLGVLQ